MKEALAAQSMGEAVAPERAGEALAPQRVVAESRMSPDL
jgi:hypothetical protein